MGAPRNPDSGRRRGDRAVMSTDGDASALIAMLKGGASAQRAGRFDEAERAYRLVFEHEGRLLDGEQAAAEWIEKTRLDSVNNDECRWNSC